MKRLAGVLGSVLVLAASGSPDVHIRYNQAGYLPQRPKSLVLVSDEDLEGSEWKVTENGTEILSGTVGSSAGGAGDHTSHPFNHIVDVSDIDTEGLFRFSCGGSQADLKISAHPYSVFITDALRHLRTARSGSEEALNHGNSHQGDSAAILYVMDGAPSAGSWKEAAPRKTLDLRGGWYDAGDYIKFTLTIATTAYYLLEAYEANPLTFTRVLSSGDLPDVLDEARHGLDYLMKTYPEDDLFVIQVGNALDHNMGLRLPENDVLDGRRPALCAISPVHMGIAAAALAKGARIFKAEGETELAQSYLEKAEAILQRAQMPDALESAAYEKDETNDFYRDNTLGDNMCLGALELYRATQEPHYLDLAKSLAPSAGNWISWGTYNFSCNQGLEALHEQSRTAAQDDIDYFTGNMDPIWGIPLDYTWASLLCWNGAGAAAGAWNRLHPDPAALDLHLKMVDLLFGRNNWGVCFVASNRVPNSVRNIYSQIYSLTDVFPHGAVALGPGDRETHTEMEKYFGTPPSSSLDLFQTGAAVFYDWEKDFMTCETVTMSQSYAIWLMSLAGNMSVQAPADSSLPDTSGSEVAVDSLWTFPMDRITWYLYSDADAEGNSTAEWKTSQSKTAVLVPREGVKYPYAGLGYEFPSAFSNLDAFDGFEVHGLLENEMTFRIDLAISGISDYDYHGKTVLGKGESSSFRIQFSELAQQGFGNAIDFDPSEASQLNITYYNTLKPAEVRIDSITFFSSESSTPVRKTFGKVMSKKRCWRRTGLRFRWEGEIPTSLRLCNIKGQTIWNGSADPGEEVVLPRYKGFQFLMGDGKLIDMWTVTKDSR